MTKNKFIKKGTHTLASGLTVVAQRAPMIKEFGLLAQALPQALRWAAPICVEFIGTHSVSGASTTVTPAAGSTNPTSGQASSPLTSWVFRTSPDAADDYTITGLPPGITFTFNPNSSGRWQYLQGTPTTAGTYSVSITGWRYANHSGGTSAKTVYNLTMNIAQAAVPLAITTHPAGGTYPVGANVPLSVTATGNNLTYQWKFGTQTISGATAASYTVSSFAAAKAGSYTVTVSNGITSMTSNPAALVLEAPVDTWRKQQGWTSPELADPLISGPLADPDKDGIPNVMEYCLLLDPRTPGKLPGVLENDPAAPSTYFRYTLPLNPTATDLTIGFQKGTGVGAGAWTDVSLSDPELPVTRSANSISIRIPKDVKSRFVRLTATL